MKLPRAHAASTRPSRAFTLVESLIVSTTLVIIIGSVIACNLFGLSMAARQAIWMGATTDSAQAVSTLMADIRSATAVAAGTYANNVFIAATNGGQLSGNALLITTNPSVQSTSPPWNPPWTLYYYDNVSNNLVRSNYYGPAAPGDSSLVSANPITNDVTHPIFTEVDYTGTPLTNSATTFAVSIYLSFTSLQNAQVVIESGSTVDLYQIMATVSPRLRL